MKYIIIALCTALPKRHQQAESYSANKFSLDMHLSNHDHRTMLTMATESPKKLTKPLATRKLKSGALQSHYSHQYYSFKLSKGMRTGANLFDSQTSIDLQSLTSSKV